MKRRTIILAAMLAATITVAAPAQASTKSRVAKLEKRVKALEKTIRAFDARIAYAAETAAYSEMVIDQCVLLVGVGAGNGLAGSTTSTFVQGDASLGLPDIFNWLPVTQSVVVTGGPDLLMLMDPGCVSSNAASPNRSSLRPMRMRLVAP